MRNFYFIFILSVIVSIFSCSPSTQVNVDDEIEKKIDKLLSELTLEEKVGQMWNTSIRDILLKEDYWRTLDTAILDTAAMAEKLIKYGCGSIHNYPSYAPGKEEWQRIVEQIQDYVKDNTNHNIPIIYGMDDVHGANYVMGSVLFPHQIGAAATFNPDFAFKMGEITSYEARAASLPWNYAPVLDYAPNQMWGRLFESFGEDPYLISQMGNAFIKGSQGDDLSDTTKTVVCLKHFIGYGGGRLGKDRANAIIPENYFREYYLPPFKEAIDNGALTVMISSNSVNGVPCHTNKFYITDILKGELNFQGFVISDFADIEFLVSAHLTAHDYKDAVKQAVNAGLDMAMAPYTTKFPASLIELVKEGEVPMSRIDDAVRRILRVKFKLGLFENPTVDASAYTKFASEEHIQAAYDAASESVTLLKNENSILPLSKKSKVLVTGYSANSLIVLNGAWSRTWSGADPKYMDESKYTILESIQEHVGKQNVKYVEGTGYTDDINTSKAIKAANGVDYIIVCVGEEPATEKPSDIMDMNLPEAQKNLVRELSKTGKPIILVMVQGRPRIINDIEPLIEGVLMAYLPGDEGGRAIADIIFGDVNPSGKLPYTYPEIAGNMLPYIHKKTEIRDKSWEWNGFTPQYVFGHGLSYTTFEYDTIINLSKDTIRSGENIDISIQVTNTGKRVGKEVVQLYLSDMVASIAPDRQRLKRFSKIELQPGESKEVSFTLTEEDLSFIGIENKPITETGLFIVRIGGSSTNQVNKDFYYIK